MRASHSTGTLVLLVQVTMAAWMRWITRCNVLGQRIHELGASDQDWRQVTQCQSAANRADGGSSGRRMLQHARAAMHLLASQRRWRCWLESWQAAAAILRVAPRTAAPLHRVSSMQLQQQQHPGLTCTAECTSCTSQGKHRTFDSSKVVGPKVCLSQFK